MRGLGGKFPSNKELCGCFLAGKIFEVIYQRLELSYFNIRGGVAL
jgi:hypothetical protein